VNEGALRPVDLPGENPRFELAGHHHHHPFPGRQCERVFDVHACPGNLSGMAPQGFTVKDHDLTLYGRCKDCAPCIAPRCHAAQQRAVRPGTGTAADRSPAAADTLPARAERGLLRATVIVTALTAQVAWALA